ncbi:MAG: tetratricopeptide repeat protein [Ginsengibacter sp.]
MNTNTDIPEEELEIIERYIFTQMSDEEYVAFTSKLQNDISLRNKVRSVRLLLIGVQESTLKDKIEEFHKDFFSSKKNESNFRNKVISMKRWLVAASIIVVIGAGALLFFNQSNKSDNLFAEYYKHDPGLITAMSSSDNYLFDRAMIDYKTGEYASAIESWRKLLKTNPGSDTLNYFLGSANLAQGKTDEAISYFKNVVSNAASVFYKDANWYTGLALLKSNKKKEAIPFIDNSDHQNKEALLLELKED